MISCGQKSEDLRQRVKLVVYWVGRPRRGGEATREWQGIQTISVMILARRAIQHWQGSHLWDGQRGGPELCYVQWIEESNSLTLRLSTAQTPGKMRLQDQVVVNTTILFPKPFLSDRLVGISSTFGTHGTSPGNPSRSGSSPPTSPNRFHCITKTTAESSPH